MKTLYCIILCILGVEVTFAQISDNELNYLLVREDVVTPALAANYEAKLIDLAQFLTDNNVKHVNYMTQIQDNSCYSHVAQLNNMNDINGGLKTFIRGEDKSAKFDLIWAELNENIESFRYYVVKYEPELSYAPDGKVMLDDAPYRRWNYLHFKPGTEKLAEDLLLAWKNLYANKGVKSGYRVFKGVIGLDQPVIMFTTWSESPLKYQLELEDSINLMGEEGNILWFAMMDLVRQVETVEGYYLPEYSYIPAEKN
jgi:hypothetical protein